MKLIIDYKTNQKVITIYLNFSFRQLYVLLFFSVFDDDESRAWSCSLGTPQIKYCYNNFQYFFVLFNYFFIDFNFVFWKIIKKLKCSKRIIASWQKNFKLQSRQTAFQIQTQVLGMFLTNKNKIEIYRNHIFQKCNNHNLYFIFSSI